MKEVNFVKTTLANYKKAQTHDPNNIFFITDSTELYVGDTKYGSSYIFCDEQHPLPLVGRYGYLYIDNSNEEFSIKIWDDINKRYVILPIADTTYLKSIRREDQSIIGTSGTGREDIVYLDIALTHEDIDTLFNN